MKNLDPKSKEQIEIERKTRNGIGVFALWFCIGCAAPVSWAVYVTVWLVGFMIGIAVYNNNSVNEASDGVCAMPVLLCGLLIVIICFRCCSGDGASSPEPTKESIDHTECSRATAIIEAQEAVRPNFKKTRECFFSDPIEVQRQGGVYYVRGLVSGIDPWNRLDRYEYIVKLRCDYGRVIILDVGIDF